jgi:threonine aldolase
VLVELPIREAGGQLPSWEELEALKATAAERQIPLHLDGARLWQCPAFYDRDLDAICAGFQSVYVSFYKDVGALSGAMLLGDSDFIARAAVWQRRQGGTLWSQIPSVATAAMLLDDALAKMPVYRDHALAVATALRGVPGVRILPDPPHTNLFHVIADGSVEDAIEGRARAEQQTGIRPFSGMRPGPIPGTFKVEICILSTDIAPEEAAEAWRLALGG